MEKAQTQKQINDEWMAEQKRAMVERINQCQKENSFLRQDLEITKENLRYYKKLLAKSKRGFFRSTNVFRLIGLGVLLASSFLPSPTVDILGVAGNALALTGVVLVASPTLTEIFKRLK